MRPDAWTDADPTLCATCGREACEDHLPPAPAVQTGSTRTVLTDPPPVQHMKPTELDAAERFNRLHGDEVRFDHRRKRWLLWRGHRWEPDANAEVTRLAAMFAREWQRTGIEIADEDRRRHVVDYAMKLERREALTSLLALAHDLVPISDPGDQWDQAPMLLGVPNGVVDVTNGTLRPGHPGDRITFQTAVAYDPAACCPRWEQFIREIFKGDDELIAFVHRALGYSLTGDTSEQVIFIPYGTGANGKGTLTNTLLRVLGDYAYNMPFLTVEMRDRTGIPNDLAALVNRRFVMASETNDGTRLNEARVKALTGCDPITARFLHGEFFVFQPVAKFWLSVNHKPVVRDNSYGFWRRVRLIPFTQQFTVNRTLADELAAEAPGILAWCVRGALAWQQHGLAAPPSVMEATQEYERESDPLGQFLDEACELATGSVVGATELYQHYRQWADRHHLSERERLSLTLFGRKLSERFDKLRDRTTGISYRGLARRIEEA